MELQLIRSYYDTGSNGRLYLNGERICYTIELPWRNNRPYFSCIPEGQYSVQRRYRLNWGLSLEIGDVPGRAGIIFRPALYAMRQLKGGIAPVLRQTGIGEGIYSAVAHDRLRDVLLPELGRSDIIRIIIKSEDDGNYNK